MISTDGDGIDNAEDSEMTMDHSFPENALKRPGESHDISSQLKKLKLSDVEKFESPSTSESKTEWNLCPENFLEDFLFPHMESEDGYRTLFDWLLSINVLKMPSTCKCRNKDFSLSHDNYFWVCGTCQRTVSIWESSAFMSKDCRGVSRAPSINDILYCILAWCLKTPIEEAAVNLGLRRDLVTSIYYKCATTVENYLTKEFHQFASFGGVGSVVLLDLRSDGWTTSKSSKKKRKWKERFFSLWIADTKYVPVRYWIKVFALPNSSILQSMDNFYLRNKFSIENGLVKQTTSPGTANVKSEDELEQDTRENRNCGDKDESCKIMEQENANTQAQKHRELRVLKEQQGLTQKQEVKFLKNNKGKKKLKGKDRKSKQIKCLEISESEKVQCCPNQEEHNEELENDLQHHDVSSVAEQETTRHTRKHKKDSANSMETTEFERHLNPSTVTTPKDKNVLPESFDQGSKVFNELEEHFFRDPSIMRAVTKVLDKVIVPGSLVLANEDNMPNICTVLDATQKYESVKSFSEIQALDDTGHRPTSCILDHIFQSTTDFSRRIEGRTRKGAKFIVSQFLWRQYFANSLSQAAYNILHQFGSHCNISKHQQSSFYTNDFLL